MELDSSPSHPPIHKITHENDHHLYNSFLPNRACHFLFDPNQDHTGLIYDPNHVPDDNHGDEIKKSVTRTLKFSIWKKEDEHRQSKNPSKNADYDRIDQKLHPSLTSSDKNSPIRACSHCNTTKTPLWRSGPQGPKSLCNACGIRQRKARRAMVASAATNGATAKMNKRCKTAGDATSDGKKQNGFEDFLINLSKNLAFNYRVFPEEEKDAAILLMALSSGLAR